MQGRLRRRLRSTRGLVVLCSVGLFGLGAGACGEDEGSTEVPDERIERALSLETVQGTLAVDGDIFCEVRKGLLNDSDEVSEALDRDDGLVLTSEQGNIGVRVVPPFAPDCERQVKRELDRLDPTDEMRRRMRRQEREGGGGSGNQGGGSGGSEESGDGGGSGSS